MNISSNDIDKKETLIQYEYIDRLKDIIEKKSKSLNRVLTYNVTTFGCQMNARDSEKLRGILDEIGYVRTEREEADFVIYNTCTVRENANNKVYGRLGYLNSLKKKNPHMIIALCGCMMQEADEVDTIKKKYPYVKLIFGTHNIDEFPRLLDEVTESHEKVIKVYNESSDIEKTLPSKRVYDFKCGVNIMYGCNNFCTYCIVPYVRGRERSRDVETILDEIRNDVNDGVVEVMLLGQNVNSYKGIKKATGETYTFPKLLDDVCKTSGLKRVRFMTSHPKDLSDELIEVMKNNENCCKHVHLPLQSGSDRILELMNRRYTSRHYLDIVHKIRDSIEDVAITTDIIVGFPGETELDFKATLDIIKEVKFDSVFTFEYSKRTGTKAATFDNQVSGDVVADRFDRLLHTVAESSKQNADRYVGRTMETLVESLDKEKGKLTGRLSNNYLVHFSGDKELIGKIVSVKLVKSCGFYFEGEKV